MPPRTTAGYTKPIAKRSLGGFTLIELLVTIAVMVIMATWAVPNFQAFAARSEVDAEVMRIRTALALARNTAVTRQVPVTVCPSLDQRVCSSDWKAPLMLFENSGQGGERDTEHEPILRTWPASNAGSLNYAGFGSNRYIRYQPTGTPGGQNGTFTIATATATTKVVLSRLGRTRSETL